MDNQIELSAEELSALDQIISQKESGADFIGVITAATRIVVPVVRVITMTIGDVGISDENLVNSSLKDLVKNIPVEKLIALRQSAIKKG